MMETPIAPNDEPEKETHVVEPVSEARADRDPSSVDAFRCPTCDTRHYLGMHDAMRAHDAKQNDDKQVKCPNCTFDPRRN